MVAKLTPIIIKDLNISSFIPKPCEKVANMKNNALE